MPVIRIMPVLAKLPLIPKLPLLKQGRSVVVSPHHFREYRLDYNSCLIKIHSTPSLSVLKSNYLNKIIPINRRGLGR